MKLAKHFTFLTTLQCFYKAETSSILLFCFLHKSFGFVYTKYRYLFYILTNVCLCMQRPIAPLFTPMRNATHRCAQKLTWSFDFKLHVFARLGRYLCTSMYLWYQCIRPLANSFVRSLTCSLHSLGRYNLDGNSHGVFLRLDETSLFRQLSCAYLVTRKFVLIATTTPWPEAIRSSLCS